MARTILPYKTNNRLAKLILIKAKEKKKRITDIEADLAKYCKIKPGTIKKYKDNTIEPSLPVALRMCEYFGTTPENVFELKDV